MSFFLLVGLLWDLLQFADLQPGLLWLLAFKDSSTVTELLRALQAGQQVG